MKNKLILLSGFLSAVVLYSCSDKDVEVNDGEGRMLITPSISSVVNESLSRSIDETDELLSKLHIVISNSKGEDIRYWKSYDELIGTGAADAIGGTVSVNLNTGTYKIEGWTGDSVPASFESRFYRGETKVTLEPYVETPVELACKIRNVVVAVNYDDEIDHYLKDYTFTVGNSGGALEFNGRDDRQGYFMMPAGETYLDWTLNGVLRDGSVYVKTGSTRVAKATLYTYNFKFDPEVKDGGAVNIRIDVDETPLETVEEEPVVFRAYPKVYRKEVSDNTQERLVGLGWDNAMPSVIGMVEDIDFVVTSSGLIKSVVISSNSDFAGNLDETLTEALKNGLELVAQQEQTDGDFSNWIKAGTVNINHAQLTSTMPFTFLSTLTNSLPGGTHVFSMEVTDYDYESEAELLKGEHKSVSQFYLTVSNDGSIAIGMTGEDHKKLEPNSAQVRGQIMANDVIEAGFKVRLVGSETPWDEIEPIIADNLPTAGTYNKGDNIVAVIDNLHEGWDYEYITVFKRQGEENFEESEVTRTFTTVAPQLPNSDFESWSGSSPLLIYDPKEVGNYFQGAEWVGSNGEMFWDSGNEGSSTLNKNVTTNSKDYNHTVGGQYCAKLSSQFVGLGSTIGKFAAGNMFIGRYLKTNGMTGGELGWGRPFTYRPKALKVWVKYQRGTVDRWQTNPYVTSGGPDQGIIYLALLTDDIVSHGVVSSDRGTYPIHIDTSDTSSFFDKSWDTVIASGEHVFYESTEGVGMVEITIPLEYKPGREDERPTYIMMTCSASRAGDYFCGSTNSTMWIDDMELIY